MPHHVTSSNPSATEPGTENDATTEATSPPPSEESTTPVGASSPPSDRTTLPQPGSPDRYARSSGLTVVGSSGAVVLVEATVGRASPNTGRVYLSGLPDSSVSQAETRTRAAMINSGLRFPDGDVTVNFGPASVPTSGTSCDLAFACAIICASGMAPSRRLSDTAFIAELGLDGELRPVPGVLPALVAARDAGITNVVVAPHNAAEAQLIDGMRIAAPSNLSMVAEWLRGTRQLPPPMKRTPEALPDLPDMADLRGQKSGRQALEFAAAGGHHTFLQGPPGAGKTMLAERLPSILPPLSDEEALEVTSVHSLAGNLPAEGGLIRHAPFQAPHHTTTAPALIGGSNGSLLRPGAVPLAHRGVLFLDEAPEFKREVLDALRQPLESGEVVIHRARHSARFPSQVQLVLASNPCPCAVVKSSQCVCPGHTRRRYMARLSGPLMDRIDIRLQVPAVTARDIVGDHPKGESSAAIAHRVHEARRAAEHRWSAAGHSWRINGEVPGPQLRDSAWRQSYAVTALANRLLEKGTLSGRGYDRVLRLAWTSADLNGRTAPGKDDIATACDLRLGFPVS